MKVANSEHNARGPGTATLFGGIKRQCLCGGPWWNLPQNKPKKQKTFNTKNDKSQAVEQWNSMALHIQNFHTFLFINFKKEEKINEYKLQPPKQKITLHTQPKHTHTQFIRSLFHIYHIHLHMCTKTNPRHPLSLSSSEYDLTFLCRDWLKLWGVELWLQQASGNWGESEVIPALEAVNGRGAESIRSWKRQLQVSIKLLIVCKQLPIIDQYQKIQFGSG